LKRIPDAGKVFYIRDGEVAERRAVIENWSKTLFVRRAAGMEARSWLLETLRCIQALGSKEFTLGQMYQFESELRERFPKNNFIREKLRQQLQLLRDSGLITFLGQGRYSTRF
jgi:type II restriction enzyme